MDEPVRVDEIQGAIVHVYDDIEEADNHLPNWWLWTFYLAIAFGLVYWIYFHTLGVGKGPLARYEAERVRMLENVGEVSDEMLVAKSKDPLVVPEGKRIYDTTCAACHGAEGGGKVGPNLTDEYWLRGGAPTQIYETVLNGTDKGMPAWSGPLGPGRVQQVVAYLISIRNTNAAGKGPEGEKYAAAPPQPGSAHP